MNFVKSHKISTQSDNELNELKFCEVSRNSFSNRFWSLNRPREIQQMAFAVPIFSEGLRDATKDVSRKDATKDSKSKNAKKYERHNKRRTT